MEVAWIWPNLQPKSKVCLSAPGVKNSTLITELKFLSQRGGVSDFLLKMPSFTAWNLQHMEILDPPWHHGPIQGY